MSEQSGGRTVDAEAPVGHVVHLVSSFDDTRAPQVIGFRRRGHPAGRWVLWGLISLAVIGPAIALINLWTADSQWWFTLILTVMVGLFVFGCVAVFAASIRRSRSEDLLAKRWAQTREHPTSTEGLVTDRRVSLLDDGGVSYFVLVVTGVRESPVHARWYRNNPDNRGETLLQTQIPAIGSRVRIWSVGMPDDDGPVVVEALDPSVVH